MSAILKLDFQKEKQLHFSAFFFQMSAILKFDFPKKENNYIFQKKHLSNLLKKDNFACDSYIFPKTRANKNKRVDPFGCP